ncbi:MAG: aldo/keto reductase [Candidatus Firestonebacteria bacterium]|nr:aldo/keto reductase [Candidatus Firestonebacteria bacterium]
MLYKEYGKTGKKISVIGFGGMRFLKDGETYDLDKCAALLQKASELGVNYFDTAPSYNQHMSEVIFGHAFKNMPKPFYVSTKSNASDGDKLRENLETSLKTMNVQKINFFHIWGVNTLDIYRQRIKKDGAYDTALRAKKEGLIEHLVFSTHCRGDEIAKIVRDGVFEGVTLGYNILNFPFRQEGLKAACEQGLGVAVMNPLSGGAIPKKAEYFDYIRNPDDATVTAAALRFLLSHKEITVALCGMATIEEVIADTEARENIKEFPESKKEEIKKNLSLSMDKLCTGCNYCEGCPSGVDVAKHMLAYNQDILVDRERYFGFMKFHWGLAPEAVEACTECGECEKKCTQHLNIIERFKEIAKWAKEQKK